MHTASSAERACAFVLNEEQRILSMALQEQAGYREIDTDAANFLIALAQEAQYRGDQKKDAAKRRPSAAMAAVIHDGLTLLNARQKGQFAVAVPRSSSPG